MSLTGFPALEQAVHDLDVLEMFIINEEFFKAGVTIANLRKRLVILRDEAKERYDAL